MRVKELRIENYKIFKAINVLFNDNVNIFVGENDSGKTTILEALSMVLTGKINGGTILSRLTPDWFNNEIRNQYINDIKSSGKPQLPLISIEAYFDGLTEQDEKIKSYRGANNSRREDHIGVKLEIKFNEEYSETYKQLLSEQKIDDIPIELYKVDFRSFAGPDYYINATSKKVAYIDATKKDYGVVLNKFVASSINEYLSEEERTNLRLAYRSNRHNFTDSEAVKNLNAKLQAEHSFRDKHITLNLRENDIDGWKSEMSLSLDNIPLDNAGFGTQNMVKTEMFIQQNIDVDILIIEEPENNLSYTNMSILISRLSENTNKQIFISTHSSFVANKMGLQNIHLVGEGNTKPFKELSKATYNYFIKLPGFNTLRVLLANKIILVEGPADELIIQRAYKDNYRKLPIEDGIDVMSVGGVAFKRYCELAQLINKNIVIVTDNDGNPSSVKECYSVFADIVDLCIEEDKNLNTLEPSVLNANKDNFEDFRAIIYHKTDIKTIDYGALNKFMEKNKAEWSMRVFLSDEKINYPKYILKAIGIADDEQ